MLLEPLTEREVEILRLIADGLSNREIGQRLHLSTETVKWYNKRAYAKLDVGSRTQAVARARELGVLEEDTPPATAPAEAGPPRRHNLPAQLTSFIGRQKEIEAIESLLQRKRLLTLTGTGGTGKTRLALEVARRTLPHYRDGVTFVGLAPLDDPGLVLDSVAQTLDIKEQPGESLLDSLRHFLARRQLLLLLDNFEHLLPAAPEVGDLLAAAPQLTVLVTSREPLRLSGEQEYPLPPLELPSVADEAVEAVVQAPAVRLFTERARAVRRDFELDAHTARTVSRICTLLDGLPLGIELAAARTRLFSPQALLARLQGATDLGTSAPALQLLSLGARDLPERQQTLRATIDWSYHLLAAKEQALFRRLAIFAGGCTLEAVQAVCGSECEEADELIDLLSSLVDKNLLRVEDGPMGEPRFGMLHVIRAYARERLERSAERQEVSERHARYFMGLAEKGEPELKGSEQFEWLGRLENEHDNLRAALAWSRDSQQQEVAMRLAAALAWFWNVRGHASEGRNHLESVLSEAQGEIDPQLLTRILRGAGILASAQGDYGVARNRFEEALEISRHEEDLDGSLRALNNLGFVAADQGNYVTARSYLEKSLEIAEEIGEKRQIALALSWLGDVGSYQGDYEAAESFFGRSLDISKEIGDERQTALALHNLSYVATHRGNYAEARAYLARSLAIAEELDDKSVSAHALGNLGIVAYYQGDFAEARSWLERSLANSEEVGDRRVMAYSLSYLGKVAGLQGDHVAALSCLTRSLAIGEEIGEKRVVAHALGNLGNVAIYDADLAGARSYLERSLAMAEEVGEKRQLALTLSGLGVVALDQGNRAEARSYQERSLAIAKEMGENRLIAKALVNLGSIAASKGDLTSAWLRFEESLGVADEVGIRPVIAQVLCELSVLEVSKGNALRASRLWGAAERLRDEMGVVILPNRQARYERGLARARDQIGEEGFGAAVIEGRAMAIEDVIAYAFEPADREDRVA